MLLPILPRRTTSLFVGAAMNTQSPVMPCHVEPGSCWHGRGVRHCWVFARHHRPSACAQGGPPQIFKQSGVKVPIAGGHMLFESDACQLTNEMSSIFADLYVLLLLFPRPSGGRLASPGQCNLARQGTATVGQACGSVLRRLLWLCPVMLP